MGKLKVDMTKEDDGGKKMQWNNQMDDALAEILRSERKSGRKGDGGWKSSAYTKATLKMSDKYNIVVTKEHVKNHLKGWKRTYGVVSEIISQSGFSWDNGRKMLTIDDDNVWDKYAKTHTEVAKYRYKTIPNWEDIVDLCAKDRTTGFGAETAYDASETRSIEEEDNRSINRAESAFEADSLKRKSVSSTSTTQQKKIKVEERIAMAVSEMTFSIKEMASSIVSKKSSLTVNDVYEEITKILDLEEDVCWKATEMFVENATKFKILKKIPVVEKKKELILKSMS